MFCLGIFLLSLFVSVDAMELARKEPSKDWISLKALVRLEGYSAAKARGARVTISTSIVDLIKNCEHQLPGDVRNHVAFFVKRNMYTEKPLYSMRKREQRSYFGNKPSFFEGDSGNVKSLCIDTDNNQLFVGTGGGLVSVFDLATKKIKTRFNCFVPGETILNSNLYVNEQGFLVFNKYGYGSGSLYTSMTYDRMSYKLIEESTIEKEAFVGQLDCSDAQLPFDIDCFVAIKDVKRGNLMHIDTSCIAIDPREGTLYVGDYACVDSFSPLFNHKFAMHESDLLTLAAAYVDNSPEMKRSGDGCTIL